MEAGQPQRSMDRQPQSIPVSLMAIVLGLAIVYSILHGHEWRWNGNVTMMEVWEHLSIAARALFVVGLILNAYGVGALIDALTRTRLDN